MIGHKDAALAKSHSGLILAFGQRVVKTGHVPAEHGRALSAISRIRMVADYSGDGVSEEDARAAIDMAAAFIAAIESLLARKTSQ